MGAFKAVAKEQGLENVPCLQRKSGLPNLGFRRFSVIWNIEARTLLKA